MFAARPELVMKPFIYILIRVSAGREEVFRRCWSFIRYQAEFINYGVIISYDHQSCEAWLKDFRNDPLVISMHGVLSFDGKFFYNNYCNTLKSKVPHECQNWFMFLDCDDYFESTMALSTAAQYLTQDCDAVVFQMSRAGGKVKPSTGEMLERSIVRGHIGMPCLFLNAKFRDLADIPSTEDGDFIWIKTVTDQVRTKFVTETIVHSPRRNFGKPCNL